MEIFDRCRLERTKFSIQLPLRGGYYPKSMMTQSVYFHLTFIDDYAALVERAEDLVQYVRSKSNTERVRVNFIIILFLVFSCSVLTTTTSNFQPTYC